VPCVLVSFLFDQAEMERLLDRSNIGGGEEACSSHDPAPFGGFVPMEQRSRTEGSDSGIPHLNGFRFIVVVRTGDVSLQSPFELPLVL
jgi:hypothetical protein